MNSMDRLRPSTTHEARTYFPMASGGIFCVLMALMFARTAVCQTLSAPGPRATAKLAPVFTPAKAGKKYGLSVGPNGILEKDGRPYRGIGVDWVTPLFRLMRNPDDPAVPHDFQELRKYHIPFIRFPTLGGWQPRLSRSRNLIYLQHPRRYFHAFDKLVRMAEQNHVGLIPSLFFVTNWPNKAIGENGLKVWTKTGSRVYKLWSKYVRQVVRRYRSSPAIWGWEFGNELNLGVDLPRAAHYDIKPSWDYTHAQMWKIYRQAYQLIRRYDPYHIISTGNSFPRGSSWHNMMRHTWAKDTPAQWAYMLRMDNASMDVISVHAYGPRAAGRIYRAAALSRRWKKPLFVGEFGPGGPMTASRRRQFKNILTAIIRAKVPLAAMWTFHGCHGQPQLCVTPTNSRAWMLQDIEAADERFQKQGYAAH